MQYPLIDAKESLESLHVAVVLPKRILKSELLLEVNSCPVRVGGVPEDPARPILQFNDKIPNLDTMRWSISVVPRKVGMMIFRKW